MLRARRPHPGSIVVVMPVITPPSPASTIASSGRFTAFDLGIDLGTRLERAVKPRIHAASLSV